MYKIPAGNVFGEIAESCFGIKGQSGHASAQTGPSGEKAEVKVATRSGMSKSVVISEPQRLANVVGTSEIQHSYSFKLNESLYNNKSNNDDLYILDALQSGRLKT